MAAPAPKAYQRVKRQITEALRQTRWRHGEAIPSEPLLASRYGVSVGTIRRAVGELVAEKILVRAQGSGTYVASHTRDYMLNLFFRIEDRDGKRELPRSQLISFELASADVATARFLRLRRGEPVYRIRALLSLKGRPAIVDDIRLPVRLFPDLDESTFADREGTLYGMLQDRYGITVLRIEETIEAALADASARRLLRIEAPAAVLRIRRTAYAYKDVPVDTRVRHVDTTRHRYVSLLGGG